MCHKMMQDNIHTRSLFVCLSVCLYTSEATVIFYIFSVICKLVEEGTRIQQQQQKTDGEHILTVILE